MIDRTHDLSLTQQARLLGLSRASVYYTPRGVAEADLATEGFSTTSTTKLTCPSGTGSYESGKAYIPPGQVPRLVRRHPARLAAEAGARQTHSPGQARR